MYSFFNEFLPQLFFAVGYCRRRPCDNPELTNVLPSKPGVGQKIVMHAFPTARNFFLVLILTFQVHSPSFFKILSLLFNCVIANAVSRVGPLNKPGQPARYSHKRFEHTRGDRVPIDFYIKKNFKVPNMCYCAPIERWMVGFLT